MPKSSFPRQSTAAAFANDGPYDDEQRRRLKRQAAKDGREELRARAKSWELAGRLAHYEPLMRMMTQDGLMGSVMAEKTYNYQQQCLGIMALQWEAYERTLMTAAQIAALDRAKANARGDQLRPDERNDYERGQEYKRTMRTVTRMERQRTVRKVTGVVVELAITAACMYAGAGPARIATLAGRMGTTATGIGRGMTAMAAEDITMWRNVGSLSYGFPTPGVFATKAGINVAGQFAGNLFAYGGDARKSAENINFLSVGAGGLGVPLITSSFISSASSLTIENKFKYLGGGISRYEFGRDFAFNFVFGRVAKGFTTDLMGNQNPWIGLDNLWKTRPAGTFVHEFTQRSSARFGTSFGYGLGQGLSNVLEPTNKFFSATVKKYVDRQVKKLK